MGIFDNFFNSEALEKERQRARAGRSASDARVDREIARQDLLRTDPTLIKTAMGDEEEALAAFDYKSYCADFHAAMARPVRVDGPLPGMPGYVQHRRLQAVIDEVLLQKAFQEKQKQRGF